MLISGLFLFTASVTSYEGQTDRLDHYANQGEVSRYAVYCMFQVTNKYLSTSIKRIETVSVT